MFIQQLGSAYAVYSGYKSYKVISDAKKDIDSQEKYPVDVKWFDGNCYFILFSLLVQD